jgi:threonylcarbamoyladenosine tRNA methylthiotransferase MtaB
LATEAIKRGYTVVDFEDDADIYVINTCTVTAQAEKKCRQTIARAVRRNGRVVVMGCFSQLRPEVIRQIEGVEIILGTNDKEQLFNLLEAPAKTTVEATTKNTLKAVGQNTFTPLYSTTGRTRAFFKIQDGCNNFCTYCAVPYARGRSRSASVADTVRVAEEIAAKGIKEVIFTGVNIGDFGSGNNNGNETLADLIRALLPIDGIERYRISSIEPDLLTEEIIDLVASEKKLMPHFHIPLQSGSNAILRDMKRHYKRELFAEKVNQIHSKIPHAFIAADVIVGFPTETEELFNETYEFLLSLPVSALHVFTYSNRPEALASRITPVNTAVERKRRSEKLHQLSQSKKESFCKKFEGQDVTVLWEGHADKKEKFMFGYTENYLRVKAPFNPEKINTLSIVNCQLSIVNYC